LQWYKKLSCIWHLFISVISELFCWGFIQQISCYIATQHLYQLGSCGVYLSWDMFVVAWEQFVLCVVFDRYICMQIISRWLTIHWRLDWASILRYVFSCDLRSIKYSSLSSCRKYYTVHPLCLYTQCCCTAGFCHINMLMIRLFVTALKVSDPRKGEIGAREKKWDLRREWKDKTGWSSGDMWWETVPQSAANCSAGIGPPSLWLSVNYLPLWPSALSRGVCCELVPVGWTFILA